MKFSIDKDSLLSALQWTQSVSEKKTTLPILTHLLLELRDAEILISATDLEVGMQTRVPAVVEQSGKLCLPSKNFYEIIREFPAGEIRFQLIEQDRLEIASRRSRFKIVGLPASDFPHFLTAPTTAPCSFTVESLSEVLEKTAFAIASDESIYYLHGLFIEIRDQKLCFVATDSHRLGYVERPLEVSLVLPKGIIVPKKGVQELRRLVAMPSADPKNPDRVEMHFEERHLIAKRGDVVLFIRLLDAQYPDYRRVLPKIPQPPLTLNRLELVSALKRVSLLLKDRTRAVRFDWVPEGLELSTSSAELGEAKEEISVSGPVPPCSMGINSRYMLEALQVLNDPNLLVEINGQLGPCVLRVPSDTGFMAVVMPMRV